MALFLAVCSTKALFLAGALNHAWQRVIIARHIQQYVQQVVILRALRGQQVQTCLASQVEVKWIHTKNGGFKQERTDVEDCDKCQSATSKVCTKAQHWLSYFLTLLMPWKWGSKLNAKSVQIAFVWASDNRCMTQWVIPTWNRLQNSHCFGFIESNSQNSDM